MFITITGELGSGKTTVARILNQEYGFDFYSTGSIQREIAKEKGITTLELNQLMSNDVNNIYDKMIDDKTVEISRKNAGKDLVFDSRMAWHFVERSFKVYVTVDPYMAAQRVIRAGRGVEEQYGSFEEAAESLRKRKQLEDSRFAEIYSVRTTDFSNYDLIVDSTFITPEELADIILENARGENAGQQVYRCREDSGPGGDCRGRACGGGRISALLLYRSRASQSICGASGKRKADPRKAAARR